MNYQLSTDKLKDPVIKEILAKLSSYFKGEKIQFYLIGATARDIVLSLHGEKPKRATRDLDIAIAISDWAKYTEIEDGITMINGFRKDTAQKQRFLFRETFQVDIVPFGDIKKEDDRIYSPPDETVAMTSLGFPEAQADSYTVDIDGLTIDVASLAGIFILKMFAWIDRNPDSNSDADDMGFIINIYLSIYEQRAIEDYYSEIYLMERYTNSKAGSKLLGIDIARILQSNPATRLKVSNFLKEELEKEEESRLINQILETNYSFDYDEVIQCLYSLLEGMKLVSK